MLRRALRVVEEVLREELQVPDSEFYTNVYEAVQKEVAIELSIEEFRSVVETELRERKWNIRDFRNSQNQPITNVFKSLLKRVANVQLSNDKLSRVLNTVRKHYSASGVLRAGLYPPVAFREREKWGLPHSLGDDNSCFREGGCNEGSVDWLIAEYKNWGCAYLVVFEYNQGGKKGVGRCWAYTLQNNDMKDIAIFATNFYSCGMEIKDETFKYAVVRLLRMLFNMSDGVRFATWKSAPLPIYLNEDGYVIYEPSSFENSDSVLDAIGTLKSYCLWCGSECQVGSLYRYSGAVKYGERYVKGLIVCPQCKDELDDMVECEDCGEYIYRDEAVYIEDYGYICRHCFDNEWFYCDACGLPERRDYAVFAPDGRVLCEHCASRLGTRCALCGEYYYHDDNDGEVEQYEITCKAWTYTVSLCRNCAEEHLRSYQCEECGVTVRYLDSDFMTSEILRDVVRLGLCAKCYQERKVRAYAIAFENKVYWSLFAWGNLRSESEGEDIIRQILYGEEEGR